SARNHHRKTPTTTQKNIRAKKYNSPFIFLASPSYSPSPSPPPILKVGGHLLDSLPLGCVFNGEICVLDREGKPDFNSLLFRRGEPVYVAFDLLFCEGEDVRGLPLKERRGLLDQVAQRYGLQKSELFIGCGTSLYRTVCEMDLEASSTNGWKISTPGGSVVAESH